MKECIYKPTVSYNIAVMIADEMMKDRKHNLRVQEAYLAESYMSEIMFTRNFEVLSEQSLFVSLKNKIYELNFLNKKYKNPTNLYNPINIDKLKFIIKNKKLKKLIKEFKEYELCRNKLADKIEFIVSSYEIHNIELFNKLKNKLGKK